MKEIRVKGNTITLDDGKVFISNNESPIVPSVNIYIAQNIKYIAIYHKVGYDENNKRKYFLTGTVGFIGSEYNRATFYGVEKILVDEENNSMEVYILF